MWEILWENILATTLLEWLAVGFLLGYVILATRQIPWAWPVSMVGVVLYAIIAYEAKIYAEVPLQAFYFFISIYGFYIWKWGGKEKKPLPVTTSSGKQWLIYILLGITLTIGWGYALDIFTDTDVAYLDAFTTGFSLIATWMQARKKVENWLFWLVIDIIYIGLFFYKGYYLIAFLNVIYLFFATYGFINWYKDMKKGSTT